MPALVFDAALIELVSGNDPTARRKQIVAYIRDVYHVCTVMRRQAARSLALFDNCDDDDDESDESDDDELEDDEAFLAFDSILARSGGLTFFIQDWASFVLRPIPADPHGAFVRLLRGYYPADDLAQARTVFAELPANDMIDVCCRQTVSIPSMVTPLERLNAHELIMDARLPGNASDLHKSLLAIVKLINAIVFASEWHILDPISQNVFFHTTYDTYYPEDRHRTAFRQRFDRVIEYRSLLDALFLKFRGAVLIDARCWFPPFSYVAGPEDIPSPALLACFINNTPAPDPQSEECNNLALTQLIDLVFPRAFGQYVREFLFADI